MTMTRLLPVGLFTALYMLIATPFALAHQNTEFLFYIGIVILFAVIIVFIDRKVHFSQGLLWALSLWGLMHMLGGLLEIPESWPHAGEHAVLYSWWIIPGYIKYDNPTHAYGFAVATWVCWEALKGGYPNIKPTLGILALCAFAGMGLGALNEVIEFAATLMIPGTNVGGYINTGWDLVANLIGSLMTVLLIALFTKDSANAHD